MKKLKMIFITLAVIVIILLLGFSIMQNRKLTVLTDENLKLNELVSSYLISEKDYDEMIGVQKETISLLESENNILLNEKTEMAGRLEDQTSYLEEENLGVSKYIQILEEEIYFEGDSNEIPYYYKGEEYLDFDNTASTFKESIDFLFELSRSFNNLTELTEATLTKEQVDEIGNMDWGKRMLKANSVHYYLDGSLEDLNYLSSKYKLANGIMRYMIGDIEEEDLEVISDDYKISKVQYEEYIETALYAD